MQLVPPFRSNISSSIPTHPVYATSTRIRSTSRRLSPGEVKKNNDRRNYEHLFATANIAPRNCRRRSAIFYRVPFTNPRFSGGILNTKLPGINFTPTAIGALFSRESRFRFSGEPRRSGSPVLNAFFCPVHLDWAIHTRVPRPLVNPHPFFKKFCFSANCREAKVNLTAFVGFHHYILYCFE